MSSEFYTQNGWKGEKYNRESSTKDIAKAIRRDIKAKYGKEIKTSVRTEHFSGGSAIDITIKNLAENPINPNWDPKGEWNSIYNQKYTEDTIHLIGDLTKIGEKYQWKDADGMIDYCNCNFYLSVSFDYMFESAAMNEVKNE